MFLLLRNGVISVRFFTTEECESWLAERKRTRPEREASLSRKRFDYPEEPYRIYNAANWVARSTTFRQPALLWITEWSIWASSENWHLYYKLRQSYGDLHLLQDSPGHLFLGHESEDLSSFLQLSILNGWGGYILTDADYVNTFFSHDEYFEFFAKSPGQLPDIAEFFGTAT